jgi:predicted transcriptional regulator
VSSTSMSLRLPENLANELAALARIEEVAMSEAIRMAIVDHIGSRSADPNFQARLRRRLEEDREVAERLIGAGIVAGPDPKRLS